MEAVLDIVRSGRLFVAYQELINRICNSDEVTEAEFLSTFEIYDTVPNTASLGMYLLVQHPYLFLLRRPLRQWMRAMGELPHTSMIYRTEYAQRFNADIRYTADSARKALSEIPALHELMIRAVLMLKGFSGARHWEQIARGQMVGGVQAIANVILHHLREGPIYDIRLLLSGPEDGFDGEPLIQAITNTTIKAVGSVCAARAPELFLHRHWRLGLTEASREEMCRRIAEDANYWLTEDQRRTLVRGEALLPPRARQDFARRWDIRI